MTEIPGGVCAAQGFRASGIHAGLKKNPEKPDLALIAADCPCAAAAVYTQNLAAATPLALTRRHLSGGFARAALVNSGNANAWAEDSLANAERCCRALAAEMGIGENEIIVNSTGVIGRRLPVEIIEAAMPALVQNLAASPAASLAAAAAIMTTDTKPKEAAVGFELSGKPVRLGAIAKGSGMLHPNMATMIALLTTDCAIEPALLRKALGESARLSYNRVSVDGDTSTNDMCAVLASGLAGNRAIAGPGEDYGNFLDAMNRVNLKLARLIAADGEGATKLITCRVEGANSREDAEALSRAVVASALVKAAMFGADANWGRVLCAMGYSGAPFDPSRVGIAFSDLKVCEGGMGLDFDEDAAKKLLSGKEVYINITAGGGPGEAEAYGCDLTYDYVRINGDYRS
ncbi:MAG: bifunctional glutamate N-acetyltransferase/amino-acid acetyltransferase ArgJ [Oscillospiraceae bacterium]|nr:bifunctional glutamate N-acetyltransferase/amino-acid acetyltransferase ArgJ [Oscillospiraceae bacterium]